MSNELARDLITAGVHFGHGVSRWNPKMEPYIFGKRGMIHIINVKETIKGLLIAEKLLADVVASGKDVMFVGTKRQASEGVQRAAESSGMHYVKERWLGGTLTNFRTIRSRLQRLEELEQMVKDGSIDSESKKQASRLKREYRKIKTNLEGMRKMNRLPGVVVVIDQKKENIALREANKLGIATIGILDTDSDPDEVDVAVPANDDSIKAINIILEHLAQAVNKGKTMPKPAGMSASGVPVRGRSRRRALASAAEDEEDQDEQPESREEAASPAPQSSEPAPQEPQPKSETESESSAAMAHSNPSQEGGSSEEKS